MTEYSQLKISEQAFFVLKTHIYYIYIYFWGNLERWCDLDCSSASLGWNLIELIRLCRRYGMLRMKWISQGQGILAQCKVSYILIIPNLLFKTSVSFLKINLYNLMNCIPTLKHFKHLEVLSNIHFESSLFFENTYTQIIFLISFRPYCLQL